MKFTVPAHILVPAAALLGFGVLQAMPAVGQATPSASTGGASDRSGFSHIAGFDHIQTDDVKYNLNTGEFSLKDRFTAVREDTDITADSGSGNSKKKQLHARATSSSIRRKRSRAAAPIPKPKSPRR